MWVGYYAVLGVELNDSPDPSTLGGSGLGNEATYTLLRLCFTHECEAHQRHMSMELWLWMSGEILPSCYFCSVC